MASHCDHPRWLVLLGCCQGPALEQSPLIICCALHPTSLCPQLREAVQGLKKEPACCWLVVCPIPASRTELTPAAGLGGAGAAEPSW